MSSILERLFSLAGKTVLITGASGGIGATLALAMAEAGATVGIHGLTAEKLRETERRISERGGHGVAFQGTLAKADECRAFMQKAHAQLGRLDVLITCAGVNRRKPMRDATEEDFEWIVGVNLRAVYFLCQAAHEIMREQGGGKIITIGSVTSTEGLGGVSIYGVTKAGVAQLTRTMALEWARHNIQVNCLAPGFIRTPLTAEGLWGDAHRKQWLLDRIAARRAGEPGELVGAALLLASAASSYLTGQTVNVDGGYLAGGSWLRDDE